MLCERLLAILVKEELRIGKACPQDALVAVRHHIQMLPAAVAHSNKDRKKTAVRRLHREVPLMVTHGRDDRLGGQREIFLLECTAERGRILDKIKDFLKEVGRDLCRTARRLRRLCNLLRDHGTPTLLVNNNICLFTRRLIVCGRRDDKVLRGKRTMSA